MIMSKLVYKNQIVFHPGYYIRELLEHTEMNQNTLAKRLGISQRKMKDLIDGKGNLSENMAMNLSIVLGTSVSLWLNLNQKYLEKKLEIERQNKVHTN